MSFLSRIVRKPLDLIEYKIWKVKSQIKEQVSEAASKLALVIVMLVMLCFGVLFASIGLSIYLNHVLGSDFFGFIAVSLIYIAIFFILFLARNKNTLFQKFKKFSLYIFKNNKLP